MTKLTKTEAEVLKAIANGQRIFTGTRESVALHRLADRGILSVTIKTATVPTRYATNFGRNVTAKTQPDAAAIVSAPKIEAAIAAHGLATFLKSIV